MKNKKMSYYYFMKSFMTVLFLLFAACSSSVKPQLTHDLSSGGKARSAALGRSLTTDEPSQSRPVFRYDEIFQKARAVLKQENNKEQLKISKNVPESALIEYLQKNPSKLMADQSELLQTVQLESKSQKDLSKHLRLIPPTGMSGYSDLQIFVSHPYYMGKKLVKESNLVQVWSDFLKQAEKKIMLNVFDFDLQDIATVLAAKAQKGVSVTVGIDQDVIKHRPEVAAIYEYLKRNQVRVVPVDSISLNHQKMAVIDWEIPETAKVLFSSGNLTQSCLGPEGDLKSIQAKSRPERSVPNANHVITMNSWLIANLIYNELTKTLGENYHYRGAQYPVLGSYQITGPGVDPQTFEAYPEESVTISFSPGGGFKNINKNIIGHFIRDSNGPIRMIQFAFSSKDVTEALVEKAQAQKSKFDFMSVGDTPFAMQGWSQFLVISGLERFKNASKENEFFEPKHQIFREVLGDRDFNKLRSNVKIAPWYYSNAKVKVDGKSYDVSAKIHHKILSAGDYAILGTSFNFSESAQKNNEQILVFKSKKLAAVVDGMTRWLAEKSERSVFQEALRRNKRVQMPENLLPSGEVPASRYSDESDDLAEVDSSEAKQARP